MERPLLETYRGKNAKEWYQRYKQLEEALQELTRALDEGHSFYYVREKLIRAQEALKRSAPPSAKQQLIEALETVLSSRRHEHVPSRVYYITAEVLDEVETALKAAKEKNDADNY